MNEYAKTVCRECGAVNGPGAPRCHTCGTALLRAGMAARPADDDEDDEPPRKPVKKPAPDAVQKGIPPKKKPTARPMDDEDDAPRKPAKKVSRDDADERRPIKKKVSRRDDDEDDEDEAEEPASLRDNTLLNMLFPVGVSIWAMSANYLGVLSLLGVVFGLAIGAGTGIERVAFWVPLGSAFFGFLALIVGVLSFIIRPKKTTYGSVTGYMRAIIGIVCGLIGLVGGPIAAFVLAPSLFVR